MPLAPPTLDNRTFEQIVAEIRRRIPTYTPEWTDLNDGDPGITLAQLFAFMSDQLLFQVNQVPDKGLATFLKMVGFDLHPATPAVADITFTPVKSADATESTFDLAARTQVQTAGPPPGQKAPITFETIRRLTVWNGSLVDIVVGDCTGNYKSHKAENDSRTGTYQPLGLARTTEDALYLVLDLNVAGETWPEGTLRIRVDVAGSDDVGEPDPDTTGGAPRIAWSFSTGKIDLNGASVVDFTPLTPSLDSTRELTQSGYLELSFTAPGMVQRADNAVLPGSFRNRFILRAQVLRPGAYGATPPAIKSIRINTVTARALVTIDDEQLGRSTGLPFQRFQLAHTPVFPGTSSILIDESTEGGDINAVWTETDDLFAAGLEERVYQLFPATGEILFGDGKHGKIPPPDDGKDPAGNIKKASYQFGGGLAGNVGAGTLTRALVQSGLVSFDAVNTFSARGGDEEEPVSAGLTRAPAVVRSRYRAVSGTDFEALAKETPETRIARAHGLSNTRPGRRPGSAPGSVTLVLVPSVPFDSSIHAPISLLPETAAFVRRYLDARRLVTTELYTASARFRTVTVDATLELAPGASISATRAAATAALHRYFHALAGGDDGLGWPFGGTIHFSGVFQRLLGVGGVRLVERLSISLDGGDAVECRDIQLCPGELLFSGAHVVRIRGAS